MNRKSLHALSSLILAEFKVTLRQLEYLGSRVKLRFASLPGFLIIILTALLMAGCSSSSSNSATDADTKISCKGEGELDSDGFGGVAYDFKCEVPNFPTKIKDYVLEQTVDNQSIRLFEGESWRPFLTPYRGGNSQSCKPAIWVVRWRSQNPSVKVDVSGTYGGFDMGDPTDFFGDPITDGSFDEDSDWVAFLEPEQFITGSAGYEMAPSCSQPVFRWNSNPAGDANLADVSFEYQIWTYKQDI